MDYVKYMRSMIGHKPFIGCTAGVVIVQNGLTLLQKRVDTGNWCYPGGFMEMSESVEQCAAREMREEMGLTPKELKFFNIFSGPEHFVVYPNGDEVCMVEHVYICLEWEGLEQPQAGEVSEIAWFPVRSLPEAMSCNCKKVLKAVFEA